MKTASYHFYAEVDVIERRPSEGRIPSQRLWVLARTEVEDLDDLAQVGRFRIVQEGTRVGREDRPFETPLPTREIVYYGNGGRTFVDHRGPSSEPHKADSPSTYAGAMKVGLHLQNRKHSITGVEMPYGTRDTRTFGELSPDDWDLDAADRRLSILGDRLWQIVVSHDGKAYLKAPFPVWVAPRHHQGAFLLRPDGFHLDLHTPMRSFPLDRQADAMAFAQNPGDDRPAGVVSGEVVDFDPTYATRTDLHSLAVYAGGEIARRLSGHLSCLDRHQVQWWHDAHNIGDIAFRQEIDAPLALSRISALVNEAERQGLGNRHSFEGKTVELFRRRLAQDGIEPASIEALGPSWVSGPRG